MRNWAEMTNGEKSIRMTSTVSFASRLAECARREDVLGTAICGLSAVAAMGLEPDEIRAVLTLLEEKASREAE